MFIHHFSLFFIFNLSVLQLINLIWFDISIQYCILRIKLIKLNADALNYAAQIIYFHSYSVFLSPSLTERDREKLFLCVFVSLSIVCACQNPFNAILLNLFINSLNILWKFFVYCKTDFNLLSIMSLSLFLLAICLSVCLSL